MQRQPVTQQGFEKLSTELNELKTVTRPRIIRAIAEARAHGDLKENAEYHAAREQQGFVEGRIQYLESKLSHAHIIDVTKIPPTGKVIFGVTAVLMHTDTEQEVTYTIVCEDEADFKQAKISVTSPIARSLIGKMVGDVVTIVTPRGEVEYEIMAVLHC